MKQKTISGHYDTVYSLDHNNRVFIPKNVEASRVNRNYRCVAVGDEVYLNLANPQKVREFWERYRELSDLYWENSSLEKALEYERYRENMRYLWRCKEMLDFYPRNEVESFFYLLLLPLILLGELAVDLKEMQIKEEYDLFNEEKKMEYAAFKREKMSAREMLYHHDVSMGTSYLKNMDGIVRETARRAGNCLVASSPVSFETEVTSQFATLEQIYEKVYEPSFRSFQNKQRPCRRYDGTCLEYIREGQHKDTLKRQQSKNVRSRKTAEAIEIVFGIGDMDNTGYAAALDDAEKSEVLLKDFCDHLLRQRNVCVVTSKELQTPDWQPPFKNGLIVLNLVVHCDEATPGIHLTCIPYSRGCKRGPEVQAALGRAMTGMGYPSTWKDCVDDHGEKIPKRDRNGNVICNKDGTIRFKQEPDKQGIIDWIEDQKKWIQNEMDKRYGWKREYKGSHSRGNLPTPDYRVARAKERLAQVQMSMVEMTQEYAKEVHHISEELNAQVATLLRNESDYNMIVRYLELCTDDEYEKIIRRTNRFFIDLVAEKEKRVANDFGKNIVSVHTKVEEKSGKAEEKSR